MDGTTTPNDGDLRIELLVSAIDPPSGVAVTAVGDPIPFAGWMGLLRTLTDIVTAHDGPSEARPGRPS